MTYSRFLSVLFTALLLSACGAGQERPADPFRLAKQAKNTEINLRVDVVGEGTGSGVVISRSGHILTACHVACDADRLGIMMDEGGPYPFVYEAELVAGDKDWDLAVIKIDRKFEHAAHLADPRAVRSGLAVYSMGYPLSLGQVTTRGSIVRTNYTLVLDSERREDMYGMALVDIQTGPGHSGGPVYAAGNGDLVGIMHAIVGYGSRGRVFVRYTLVSPIGKVRSFLDDYKIPYNE